MRTANTYISTASNATTASYATYGIGTTTTLQMQYGASGNIISKPDAALTISYKNPPQIHQLTSLTGAQSAVPTTKQNITYYSFRKVKQISEGIYKYNFKYDAAEQRNKMEYRENNTLKYTRYYSGAYEVDTTAGSYRRVYYIYTPAGLTAMYVKRPTTDSLYYLHTDHLGSITMVTNANGAIAESFSYDAWGRRRNPTDLSYTNVPQPRCLVRGYTGHEHLAGVNLINMNGRVYDPLMGMFLSPDPVLQSPNDPLNYNRYSYCLNNPLKYTDPSGNKFRIFRAGLTLLFPQLFILNKIVTNLDRKVSFVKGTINQAEGLWNWTFNGANISELDPTVNYKQLINSVKIDAGRLMSAPWERTQSLLGNTYSHYRNMTGNVTDVEVGLNYVLVNDRNAIDDQDAFTLGVYINGWGIDKDYKHDPVFIHEFGHTIQSKLLGGSYLTTVAIPSYISQRIQNKYGLDFHRHSETWFEINANQFGLMFFPNPNFDGPLHRRRFTSSFKDLNWSWFILFNPFNF